MQDKNNNKNNLSSKLIGIDFGKRSSFKDFFVGFAGLFSALYLLNFTFGGLIPIEIPDAIPIIGNLDEAGLTVVLLSCLRYFSNK